MSERIDQLVSHVRAHRCYNHPIFKHWVEANPKPEVIGAFFHHMEGLCTASRAGWNFEILAIHWLCVVLQSWFTAALQIRFKVTLSHLLNAPVVMARAPATGCGIVFQRPMLLRTMVGFANI